MLKVSEKYIMENQFVQNYIFYVTMSDDGVPYIQAIEKEGRMLSDEEMLVECESLLKDIQTAKLKIITD